VKLRSVWFKRLILSNTRVLGQADQPDDIRKIFISPDEPREVRRTHMLKRLHRRAVMAGKSAHISADGMSLSVDDAVVFLTLMVDLYIPVNMSETYQLSVAS